MKIIIALLIFSIIIIFHELGHFSLAKANGIRVNEFCLGLGPTILGMTKGETKYSLKLLPFGGACMMEGEDGESTDDRAFGKKSVWARISVVAAGPVFNFIMAFVFSFILLSCNGYDLSLIHISEPTRRTPISYAVFCLKKKKNKLKIYSTHYLTTLKHIHPIEHKRKRPHNGSL